MSEQAEPNDYERAVTRMEQATAHLARVRDETTRSLDTAEEEYNRAERNLRAHESAPGVPLPQYRPQVDQARRAAPSRARRS